MNKIEIEKIIILNYPIYGRRYCIDTLDIDPLTIQRTVSKFKLKRIKVNKIDLDLNNKYFCYLLGIIWADGSVDKKYNRVSISLVKEDMENIEYIFNKVGIWSKSYLNNSKRKYRDQIMFRITCINFKNFLRKYGFLTKSKISPDYLISDIPINNLKFFIRGLSDGDGCFYFNYKNYTRQFILSSTYEQDWTYMESLCNNLSVSYKILRTLKKDSKSSVFRITNKDILKFGEFIYNDFFGLTRKYDKFNIIKSSYKENPYEFRKSRSKKIKIEGMDFKSVLDASVFYNINRGTLRRRLENGYYNSNYNEVKMS